MRRAAVLLVLSAALVLGPSSSASPGEIAVTVDRTHVSISLGRSFTFSTTIVNRGGAAAALVAHLNVLSLRPGVYVDPEDWSSNRTRYLGVIPAGGSRTVDWSVKAVNAGLFAVYVAVLPQTGAAAPPIAGPEIQVSVAKRTTLDSAGILPLALGFPLCIGLLAAGVRLRRRRGGVTPGP